MSRIQGPNRRFAVAALLAVFASACGGPRVPVVVGIKEVPSDIRLGTTDQRVAPIPPVGFPVDGPIFVPPIAGGDASPPPAETPPVACPPADPLSAPAREAVNTVELPPAPTAHAFRAKGSYEISGPDARSGDLPAASTRSVQNVNEVRTPGSTEQWYRFEVVATLGPNSTTTSYTLVPEDAGTVVGSRPGLFISRVQSQLPDGTREDFQPQFPGLLVLPFPATTGDTWTAAGADPRTGVAMTFTGTIGRRARVDACGTFLDAISVQLDGSVGSQSGPGTQISPNGRTDFSALYRFGTQYGGLSLMDVVRLDRAGVRSNLNLQARTTINAEPPLPPKDVPICVTGCI